MAYKETLHMPTGDFPMRAGLSQKEPILVQKWQDMHLYEKMLQEREGCEEYVLHDGPPYANGDIHCGHALNRCLKDFVIRSHAMMGYKTPFVFGWDTHGLPIEVKVTKSGVDRKATPIVEFRKICEEYAKTQVEHQKKQIQRLGCLGDYDHPYLTLLPEFEAKQVEVFASMALKGLIFKGLKPVYWSWSSESALAEAEVEYADVTSKTCYIPFDVKDGKGILDEDAQVVIWTTTPWTIPSNQGITLNPRFEYGLFSTSKGKLLFLASMKEKLSDELGLENVRLLKKFKGEELEGITCVHPLYPNKQSLLMLADFVTDDSGTGCVHTDPDHGLDDFNVSAKYGLKPQGLVDDKGIMRMGEGDPLDGLFYEKGNDKVIEMLKENGHLLKQIDIVHSYPHDWRTKKPVIFRATPQWFCSIEPIREDLLKAIKTIKWVPSWGEAKMVNMIKDRADWCISRQRVWGVPIPIFYCEDGTPILEKEVFDRVASLFREHGSSIWFEKEAKELLPEGYTNPHSPNGQFTKEKDIMDVWFDSGSSWNGVLNERGMKYPSTLYLEGNDQYRGWFNSSLITSLAVNGVAPFKECVTHGFVMDEKWQKMSKSAGNGIDPNKIANEYGADILRLWAASVDYKADARISESIIASITDNYRKIRNTFKFMLGNIASYQKESVDYSLLDRFVLAEFEEVKNKAVKGYEEYDFSAVTNALIPFLSSTMSSFYLDYAKDILYCDSLSSSRRKAIVDVIYRICKDSCLLLNPILPFTMEEVYSYLPLREKESVQLEEMPKITHEYPASLKEDFASFLKLRSIALKAMEESRAKGEIGSSSEADLTLENVDSKLFHLLKEEGDEALKNLFMVSYFQMEEGLGEAKASVKKAEGTLCARCRHIVKETVEGEEGPLCHRCFEAMEK